MDTRQRYALILRQMEITVKKRKKLLSLLLCTAELLSLASCGSGGDRGDGLNHMYDAALCGNPGSLDPQYASDESSANVIRNLYSGLLERDKDGSIICRNAESYTVSPDGTVYTFTLREDNYWFFDENNDDAISDEECFPVTAGDYEFALKRILDPRMQSPYACEFSGIKGATDPGTGAVSSDNAEIYAIDDRTLVIVLEHPDAEFPARMAEPAAFPCNPDFFYSTKGRYGLDDRSVMSNGAFYVRQWFFDPYGVNNILYMKRNDKNDNEDFPVAPGYLSYSIEADEAGVEKRFHDRETECITVLSTAMYNPKKYAISGESCMTLGLVFNPGDSVWSSENMRKALAYSIDREALAAQITDKGLSAAAGIIPPAVLLGDRSYREICPDSAYAHYDRELAVNCFNEAKQAAGAESLESVKIMADVSTVDSSYLHTLSQKWQELFGCYIGIEDVTHEDFTERMESRDYTIALCPVTGNCGIGESFIRRFEEVPYLCISGAPLTLSSSLMSCSTFDELAERYSGAESVLLDRLEFIPLFYRSRWLVCDSDNENISFDPFTGAIDYRCALNYS